MTIRSLRMANNALIRGAHDTETLLKKEIKDMQSAFNMCERLRSADSSNYRKWPSEMRAEIEALASAKFDSDRAHHALIERMKSAEDCLNAQIASLRGEVSSGRLGITITGRSFTEQEELISAQAEELNDYAHAVSTYENTISDMAKDHRDQLGAHRDQNNEVMERLRILREKDEERRGYLSKELGKMLATVRSDFTRNTFMENTMGDINGFLRAVECRFCHIKLAKADEALMWETKYHAAWCVLPVITEMIKDMQETIK